MVYAPVGNGTDTVELSPPPMAQGIVVPTAKGHHREFVRGLVLGTAELTLNVLDTNCKISRSRSERLRKHKAFQRRLIENGIVLGKKKALIVQRGGFLLTLLTAALSALPSIIHVYTCY